MVDVDGGSRVYEVLPVDIPTPAWTANQKLKHSMSYNGSTMTVPAGYNTYSIPRGVNGTPPMSRAFPPAVPPRNRKTSDGEGHNSASSLGSSPNDKGGLFPQRLKATSG